MLATPPVVRGMVWQQPTGGHGFMVRNISFYSARVQRAYGEQFDFLDIHVFGFLDICSFNVRPHDNKLNAYN